MEEAMPTKHPRVHVVLERPLFINLRKRARKNGLSLSLEAREIIKEAFRLKGEKSYRVYTGKHTKKLIGKLHMGKINLEDELSGQVHG